MATNRGEGGRGDDRTDPGRATGPDGTAADSMARSGNGAETITGTPGNDSIFGGPGADSILGLGGQDTINGAQGADFIDGGDGDDMIAGGQGADAILGGGGQDTINGAQGADFIDGGDGDDMIAGGQGADAILGGGGQDTIYGAQGADFIDGGDGDDVIEGGVGGDRLFGGTGQDLMIGGIGGDTLDGGAGVDTLFGGDGRDFLIGRLGDRVDGGTGDGGTPGDDFDTLDLSQSIPTDGRVELTGVTVDADGDSRSGTAIIRDASGGELGRVYFTEIENIIPCFTPGTLIATPRGEKPVEDLQPGDRVITRDNGLQEIRWVGHRALGAQDLRNAPHLKPVRIRAGALGHGLPERDMLVSPQHRVLFSSEQASLYFGEREVLAAARHLTGMEGIDVVDARGTTYIHFMFDQHEVILSNGAWTESFQPGEQVLDGMGIAQRDEIFELFPELREAQGLEAYQAARRSLKKHEARLLVK